MERRAHELVKTESLERSATIFAHVGTIFFLLCCFLLGGSSRADQPAQIGIRVVSVALVAVALFFIGRREILRVKGPLLFLSALLGLMLLQIIPLPPQIWRNLPGRELAASGSALIGLENTWRPTSFEPHTTLNSILATLPGFGIILLLSMMQARVAYRIVFLLAALTLLSGVLGLVQISSGQLYFYGVANRGGAVGFFANRNHQAAVLTCLIPIVAFLALHSNGRAPLGLRITIAGALTLFIIPLVFITGSRTGILLLFVGCAGAFLLIRKSGVDVRRAFGPPASWRSRAFRAAPFALGAGLIALIGTLIASGRAIAINRVFGQDVEADARLRLFTTMIDMVKTYFPIGTGFGTFPTMFKIDEPAWYLRASYFNHAHNDLLEVLIEGGVFSLALMVAFAIWWTIKAARLWRAGASQNQSLALGRLGSVLTLILTLASVVDYPLRTPLGQVIFLLATTLMVLAADKESAKREAARAMPEPALRIV